MPESERASQLFTLRIWRDQGSGEGTEWRGKVQALPDGEAYYFRDWETLVQHLTKMIVEGAAIGKKLLSSEESKQD